MQPQNNKRGVKCILHIYDGAAGILLLMKVDCCKITFVIVFFLILLLCRFHGEGHGQKQIVKCQQLNWINRKQNRALIIFQLQNINYIEEAEIKCFVVILYLYSLAPLEWTLPHTHIEEDRGVVVPIRIPIFLLSTCPPHWTYNLVDRNNYI